ncbi:hypothetical protein [Massilia glaciei]|uniref:hypothetical protein n=1 Tax=Massilia glaciei TaxID=1524097 RepID=UPI0011B1E32D|nr:hypothetical protein [Massilia glaciei]
MNSTTHRFTGLTAFALIAALLTSCGTAPVATDLTANFSGNELSTGKRDGYSVTGAIFAGTDNAAGGGWTDESAGGTWIAKIDYSGRGGIGSSVDVTGGTWQWLQADGVVHAGTISGGQVTWPASLEWNTMECGNGVARFAIALDLQNPARIGNFTGCLDDMHLDPRQQPFVFPQKIWGQLHIRDE